MPDKTAQSDSEVSLQKPGELLKEAREKLGLSQKDIASQLNLQVDILDALENNEDEKLPASAYVRGYIRSYARIVKLDGDTLVRLYENDASGPPEIIPDIKNHSQASSTDKPVKAVTYLITFALALLLIAWLQSNYVIEKNRPTTETTGDGTLGEYRENSYHKSTQDNQGNIPQPAAIAAPAPGLELGTHDNPEEISEELINNLELPDGLRLGTGEFDTDRHDIAEEELDTLPTSEDTVQFKLDRDSWIEIYDSGNNKLFKGLAKGGAELTFSGIGPFSVLLGYAPGVEVKFNGKLFDSEPYTNAGIARFKLGEQENPD
jgi:cytoskeleton protein RodZ